MRRLEKAAFDAAMGSLAPLATPAERQLMFEDYCALQPLLDHLRSIGSTDPDPVTFHAPQRFDHADGDC